MKLNWKVRFNAKNKAFLARFAVAVLLPILGYYGLKTSDLTTWQAVLDVIVKALSNPYVLGMMVVNVINILPDPTTSGLSDSEQALTYTKPK